MNQALIAIGSNIDPRANVDRALAAIAAGQTLTRQTQPTWTKPVGLTDQPDFLNIALLIETPMEKNEFKRWLKDIEDELGRDRTGEKFGSRTIDLDIVVWNGQIVDDDVFSREYLRRMVAELLPDLGLGLPG